MRGGLGSARDPTAMLLGRSGGAAGKKPAGPLVSDKSGSRQPENQWFPLAAFKPS